MVAGSAVDEFANRCNKRWTSVRGSREQSWGEWGTWGVVSCQSYASTSITSITEITEGGMVVDASIYIADQIMT